MLTEAWTPQLAVILVTVLLLLLVVFLITSIFRKPRDPRAEVPKRPLGLDG